MLRRPEPELKSKYTNPAIIAVAIKPPIKLPTIFTNNCGKIHAKIIVKITTLIKTFHFRDILDMLFCQSPIIFTPTQ